MTTARPVHVKVPTVLDAAAEVKRCWADPVRTGDAAQLLRVLNEFHRLALERKRMPVGLIFESKVLITFLDILDVYQGARESESDMQKFHVFLLVERTLNLIREVVECCDKGSDVQYLVSKGLGRMVTSCLHHPCDGVKLQALSIFRCLVIHVPGEYLLENANMMQDFVFPVNPSYTSASQPHTPDLGDQTSIESIVAFHFPQDQIPLYAAFCNAAHAVVCSDCRNPPATFVCNVCKTPKYICFTSACPNSLSSYDVRFCDACPESVLIRDCTLELRDMALSASGETLKISGGLDVSQPFLEIILQYLALICPQPSCVLAAVTKFSLEKCPPKMTAISNNNRLEITVKRMLEFISWFCCDLERCRFLIRLNFLPFLMRFTQCEALLSPVMEVLICMLKVSADDRYVHESILATGSIVSMVSRCVGDEFSACTWNAQHLLELLVAPSFNIESEKPQEIAHPLRASSILLTDEVGWGLDLAVCRCAKVKKATMAVRPRVLTILREFMRLSPLETLQTFPIVRWLSILANDSAPTLSDPFRSFMLELSGQLEPNEIIRNARRFRFESERDVLNVIPFHNWVLRVVDAPNSNLVIDWSKKVCWTLSLITMGAELRPLEDISSCSDKKLKATLCDVYTLMIFVAQTYRHSNMNKENEEKAPCLPVSLVRLLAEFVRSD